jgi:macrolide transport system ATP-binding/permease protein
MIEIRGLNKIYMMGQHKVEALKDISLTIERGDFIAVMGPSGSGKSTLTQILGLLDTPTSGSYKLNGKEVSGLTEDELAVLRRDEIGFIFQQFHLLPRMSALENVGLPLLYSNKEVAPNYVQGLLEKVRIGDRSEHRPNELSGGQQQRVAIARSLVNEPKIVMADEPTGNLDSVSEKEILATLKALNQQGITVIIVTHEEDIGNQAKRLIRMRDGVIQSDERREPLPTSITLSKSVAQQDTNLLYELYVHFKLGLKTLAANKVRTGLSMLGILIGVAAVVTMMALGNGAQASMEKELSSLGSNLLSVRSGSVRVGGVAQEAGATTRLTVDDGEEIRNKVSGVKSVSPAIRGRGQVTYSNNNWSTQLRGATADFAKMRDYEPDLGRFFTDDENRQRVRVAVIGVTVVREVFGDINPIGEMIKINKVPFQVIGVLPKKGTDGWQDQDDLVVIPVYTAMYRLLGRNYVDSLDVEFHSPESMEGAEDKILDILNLRHRVPEPLREEAFQIFNMADLQKAVAKTNGVMTLLLSSIAAISLFVGGIGIMNIMLVSVTERTREIGLRKAIGARRRDILLQFLAESVVVSFIGGLIGVILAWILTQLLASAIGWPMSISFSSVSLAFSFSAGIGLIFGVYPARKASLLNPIEALRNE